ncbi:MAG: hypothetical protein WAX80_01765 [Minisyncoccia bacterium]
MNKKYLITYDLKNPNWNYTNFFSSLQSIGPWWHYISNTWIIKNTNLTSVDIYNRLGPYLSTMDFILVVEITDNKWGYLPQDAWNWLNS